MKQRRRLSKSQQLVSQTVNSQLKSSAFYLSRCLSVYLSACLLDCFPRLPDLDHPHSAWKEDASVLQGTCEARQSAEQQRNLKKRSMVSQQLVKKLCFLAIRLSVRLSVDQMRVPWLDI